MVVGSPPQDGESNVKDRWRISERENLIASTNHKFGKPPLMEVLLYYR